MLVLTRSVHHHYASTDKPTDEAMAKDCGIPVVSELSAQAWYSNKIQSLDDSKLEDKFIGGLILEPKSIAIQQ